MKSRMIRKLLAVISCSIFHSLTASMNGAEADTLEPEIGPFAFNKDKLQQYDTFTRLQGLRSFNTTMGLLLETELDYKMVWLEEMAGNLEICYVTVPRNTAWVEPAVKRRAFPQNLGEQLVQLWLQELMKVAYGDEARRIVGGGRFHFYAYSKIKDRELHGVTQSTAPERYPALAELQDIAIDFGRYAMSPAGDPNDQRILESLSRAVEKRLGISK